MQENLHEAKKEETLQSSPKNDKEIEVLMKEYEILRNEIGFRYNMHSQITNIAFLLIGGFTAAASLLFSYDSRGIQLRVAPIIFVIILLIISILFTSLLWASLLQLLEFRHLGSYTVQFIRKRVLEILGLDENESTDLSWDDYHSHVSSPYSSKYGFDRFAMLMLTISPYAVMAVPAVLALIFGIIFFVVNFPSVIPTLGGWVAIVLIIFDLFYLPLGVWIGFRIMGVFKEIKIDWPPQER